MKRQSTNQYRCLEVCNYWSTFTGLEFVIGNLPEEVPLFRLVYELMIKNGSTAVNTGSNMYDDYSLIIWVHVSTITSSICPDSRVYTDTSAC
jgi:hypothetical protein